MARDDRRDRKTWPGKIVSVMRRDTPLAFLDLAIVLAAYMLALVLRFEGDVPREYWDNFWTFVPVVLLVHMAANLVFGVYGHMWAYASVREARNVLLAGTVASAVILVLSEALGRDGRLLPISVVALGALVTVAGFGAVRFQSRLFAFRRRTVETPQTRVLLAGAGEGGAKVVRDIIRNPSLGLEPVGIVDDDRRKQGRSLLGVPVLGTTAQIPTLVERLDVEQVLLAIPSAKSELVREVVGLCEQAQVGVRVLPSVRESVDGHVGARDLRDLSIEDLLGRQLVRTDLESVRRILRGRRVLVTGAGGSIGAEIARQVAEFTPARLIMLDRDEIHLHDSLTALDGSRGVDVVLADIRERERIFELFATYRPEVVFHAAAHKHLPMLESNPREAYLTNVVATAHVAEAALAAGCERFVLISTDKAVRPTSILGASKWFSEQVAWRLQRGGCAFSTVRFGNVLGSRGGVVQTFLQQVQQGGPVTVTDPAMTRYFMSIHESVQLVLQAAALSRGGEVFTQEMGEPVNILDLAHKVIRLSGRVPGRDIRIEITGRRPGEKVVEDLLDPEENPGSTDHPAIVASRPPAPDPTALDEALTELEALAAAGRYDELGERMKTLAGHRLTLSRVGRR